MSFRCNRCVAIKNRKTAFKFFFSFVYFEMKWRKTTVFSFVSALLIEGPLSNFINCELLC